MKIDLTGKNILVTGASRGIGKGIAEALGASGSRVAVHYNRNQKAAEQLANKIGNNSKSFQADLEYTESCTRLFNEVVHEFRTS